MDLGGTEQQFFYRMKGLEPPDSLHLQAAKGWCELHAFLEANEELEKITPLMRAHPEVLEVRWQIYANLEKWEGALDLAQAIMKLVPEKPEGYIYCASSLQELGRREQAYRTLTDAAKRFPQDEIILYDLACVCCLLGRIAEARDWLARAIEAGGDAIKLRALDDPDLEPLWQHLGEI